jgi:hypothetical protein
MTLTQFELRLKQLNPRLHIKRYGTSMAAVHCGNEHICRVPQGEITYHNATEERWGNGDQFRTVWNPTGKYAYQFLLRRGRYDTARMLVQGGYIKRSDVARLAHI